MALPRNVRPADFRLSERRSVPLMLVLATGVSGSRKYARASRPDWLRVPRADDAADSSNVAAHRQAARFRTTGKHSSNRLAGKANTRPYLFQAGTTRLSAAESTAAPPVRASPQAAIDRKSTRPELQSLRH